MENKDEKKAQGSAFKKGNFSCHLGQVQDKKEDFVKAFKGKVNVDINSLWEDIKTAKAAYFKTAAGKKFQEANKAKAGK